MLLALGLLFTRIVAGMTWALATQPEDVRIIGELRGVWALAAVFWVVALGPLALGIMALRMRSEVRIDARRMQWVDPMWPRRVRSVPLADVDAVFVGRLWQRSLHARTGRRVHRLGFGGLDGPEQAQLCESLLQAVARIRQAAGSTHPGPPMSFPGPSRPPDRAPGRASGRTPRWAPGRAR